MGLVSVDVCRVTLSPLSRPRREPCAVLFSFGHSEAPLPGDRDWKPPPACPHPHQLKEVQWWMCFGISKLYPSLYLFFLHYVTDAGHVFRRIATSPPQTFYYENFQTYRKIESMLHWTPVYSQPRFYHELFTIVTLWHSDSSLHPCVSSPVPLIFWCISK